MKKRLLKEEEGSRSSFRYKEEDPEYYGDKLDQRYGEGPEQSRSCTDVFCCILFVALIAGVVYVAIIAFKSGNPEYLIYPFDSTDQQCKFSPGYEDYPYIYIGNYKNSAYFVCVKHCPQANVPDGRNLQCKIGPNSNLSTCADLTDIYASKEIATYCLPVDQATKIANKLITDILSIGSLQKYFSDLAVGYQLLIWNLGSALVISILYSVLIRFCAGCMVWTMIILLETVLLVIGVSSIMLANDVKFVRDMVGYDDFPQLLKDNTYLNVVGGLCLFLFSISSLVMCCMCRQIQISIGIIKAAADFVRSCCSAFLIPFWITLLQLLFLGFWAVIITFLFSSNSGKIDNIDGTPFAMVVWNEKNQHLIIFYLFALLWIFNFFSGFECLWVSSTTALWYFEQGQPTRPVTRSFCRCFYHLGSIAFGSLLIAIIMAIRMVLEYIYSQMKEKSLGLSEGKAVGVLVKCCACCIACFERLIRFITENAYIMIAITGKNFCSSAKDSFYLMLRSTAQFFISHGTTKLFIMVGTGLIVNLSCLIGYFFITHISPYKNQIQSPVFMTILFALTALPIAWAFMEFYEKAANTILMCYCVQLDLSKSRKKCPPALQAFLEEYVDDQKE